MGIKERILLAEFRLKNHLGIKISKEKNTTDVSVTYYDLKNNEVYHGNVGKMDKVLGAREVSDRIYAITERLVDNLKIDLNDEEREALEVILLKTFWAYPSEILKMVDTKLISKDYFTENSEEEDENGDPF